LLNEKPHVEFSENQLVIGFCSYNLNNPYKGFQILKSALEILTLQRPDIKIKLIVLGNGTPGLIPKKIEFECKPVVNDFELAEELARINLLIVPSIADNSPSVIGEALMSGTPVIGSNAGGIPELIDGENGGIFESGSPVGLASAIEKFHKENDSNEISRNAKNRFSGQTYVRKVFPIYSN
jgi:glycosyltransferase involved in cell wall biosynthesis